MAEPALVACSHGTDDPSGRAVVSGIVAEVARRRPGLQVREAFVDVQEPTVADVVDELVSAGSTVVVVPLLLSAGYHVHVDIADAVRGKVAVAADALGPDPRLVACLADRLASAGVRPGDGLVLAAAGSSDLRAVAAVESTARSLRGLLGRPDLIAAYGSAAHPRVGDAVARLRAGGADRVVVATYLLAPGWFHDRLRESGADVVAATLAPDPRIADIVLDRYDSAVCGSVGGAVRTGRRDDEAGALERT